jgi:alcohol dehydrogenase class IV
MDEFDITMKSRVIFSLGASGRVGRVAREFDAHRAMIVTDPGIQKAGLDTLLVESLKREHIETSIFTQVEPNPTSQNVEDGLTMAREFYPDIIVALGGGSSLDAAKAVNMLRCRGGKIADYGGMLTGGSKLPPLIAIPTTAGTGSEVSPFILISDSVTHAKIVIRDIHMIPDVAILDPILTTSMPRKITIYTGVDALAHGIEAFVAKGSQPFSQALALEAIRIIYGTLPGVLERPENLDGRGQMLIASNLAGLAFTLSYLGLAHSLANPLTRVTGMAHGMAVGLTLPYVIMFNEPVAHDDYARIAGLVLGGEAPSDPKEATLALASSLTKFLVRLNLPENLKRAGVPADCLAEMAEEALRQATVRSNPREANLEDLNALYRHAYEGPWFS